MLFTVPSCKSVSLNPGAPPSSEVDESRWPSFMTSYYCWSLSPGCLADLGPCHGNPSLHPHTARIPANTYLQLWTGNVEERLFCPLSPFLSSSLSPSFTHSLLLFSRSVPSNSRSRGSGEQGLLSVAFSTTYGIMFSL